MTRDHKPVHTRTGEPPTPSPTPARTDLLQRRCACGGTPGLDGECAGCRRERLQRRAAGQTDPATVPPIVREVLGSPGRPLDAQTRASMEPRFGHDFGKVRVHADEKAAESAQAVDALAYTVGRDVVFGAGQYTPQTAAGRRLLAHELTHVVQQASLPGTPPIQYKKKKAAPEPPFFQEALEALDQEKKRIIKLVRSEIVPESVPVLEKLVGLAEAIEEGDVAAVPGLLQDFVGSETRRLPTGVPSDPLVETMVARMLLLGLGNEAAKFRSWFLKHEKEMASPSMQRKDFLSERHLWTQVHEELAGRIPARGADAALKVLDALLLLFEQLRDEMAGLDLEAIKGDQRRRREMLEATGYSFSTDVTISVYFEALIGLLKRTFASIQAAYQVVLDQAIEDLGAGKGSRYLDAAKDRLENRLRKLIDPEEERKKVGGLSVGVTRSEFEKGGGRHLDFFAKGKAAEKRSVGIQFYDQEMLEFLASEKEMSFAHVFRIRRQQILVLERIYGLEKDKQGKPTAEAQESAAAIAKLGKTGLRLENDDDWRRFLLEIYEGRRAKSSPADALTAVIKLLESFLQAFTTHTPYNIEDFGDNYLTKEFPRAMTGQLIHDCGVYALRIAYMLSLLRGHKDLQLQFRFIVLPVHVGLIITGKGLPMYIAHNDRIEAFTAKDVTALREAWIRTDEQGNPRAPTGKDEEDQFLAELAGHEFISGVDLPFALLEVPKPKDGPEAIKRKLWGFYTKRVGAIKLFGPETENPKSPLFQYHLKYLKVLDLMKAHYNNHLLPFWNEVAHKAWLKHEPGLRDALAKLKAAKTAAERKAAQDAYDRLVERYRAEVVPPFDLVSKEFAPVSAAQVEITQDLLDHPEVIGKGVALTHSPRVDEIFGGPWWSRVFYDHLSVLMSRQQVEAPFAKPEDLLWPID